MLEFFPVFKTVVVVKVKKQSICFHYFHHFNLQLLKCSCLTDWFYWAASRYEYVKLSECEQSVTILRMNASSRPTIQCTNKFDFYNYRRKYW